MKRSHLFFLPLLICAVSCSPENNEEVPVQEAVTIKASSEFPVDWASAGMGLLELASDKFSIYKSGTAKVSSDNSAMFRFGDRTAVKANSYRQICVFPFEALQSDKESLVLLGGSKVLVSKLMENSEPQTRLDMDFRQLTAGIDMTLTGLAASNVESVTVRFIKSGKERPASGIYKIDMSNGELQRTGDGPDVFADGFSQSSPMNFAVNVEPGKLDASDALLVIVKAAGEEYKVKAKPSKEIEFPEGRTVSCEVDMSKASAGTTVDADLSFAVSGAHPYLFLNDLELARIKKSISFAGAGDPIRKIHDIQIAHADSYLGAEDLFYEIPDGKRLLNMSRRALLYILPCSYAYRMTGDKKYLDRAIRDLTSVCQFKDWNCSQHSLDAGEMSVAVAVGYDWLYNDLTEAQRKMIIDALRKNALVPFKSAYGSGTYKKGYTSQNFCTSVGNWNQVCCGGMAVGALAIKDSDPELCNFVLDKCIEANSAIAPQLYGDGVYAEGYGYWGYGTNFQTIFIMALESALGTDYGLSQAEGYLSSARYIQYMESTVNHCFNYSDGGSGVSPFPPIWYLATKSGDMNTLYGEVKKLQRGSYASYSYGTDNRTLPLYIKYFDVNPSSLSHPSEKVYSEGVAQPVYIYKDGWDSQETDVYLGVKGGKASTAHGHMDAGSFVFDADGVRWSTEYGGGSYATFEAAASKAGMNYWTMTQESFRWTVNIVNNKAHSTLTVNGKDHDVNALVELKKKIQSADEYGVEFDMTAALNGQVKSATRTIKVVGKKDLVVIDKITANDTKDSALDWRMLTQASADIGNDMIALRKGNKTRYLKAEASVPLTFKEFNTLKNSYDVDLKASGFYSIGFHSTVPAGKTVTFTTTLTPEP